MTRTNRPGKGYIILMTILLLLLAGSIALFVYGCVNNRITQPRLPGQSIFAQEACVHHG